MAMTDAILNLDLSDALARLHEIKNGHQKQHPLLLQSSIPSEF